MVLVFQAFLPKLITLNTKFLIWHLQLSHYVPNCPKLVHAT